MNLTKKQVKALLDVISSDTARPVLCHAKVDTFKGHPVLVATDGYILTALRLTDEALPVMNQLIHRDELIKWYKLAATKHQLTEANIIAMATPDNGGFENGNAKYPPWQDIVPTEFGSLSSFVMNASYMVTMQTLNNMPLRWEFGNNKLAPITAWDNNNLYVIMPLKS